MGRYRPSTAAMLDAKGANVSEEISALTACPRLVATALNFVSSLLIFAAVFYIRKATNNVRRATRANERWSQTNAEWTERLRAASADRSPEGGDATEIAAPFTSGAVPKADAQN